MVAVKQIKLESFKEEDIVQLMQEVDLLRRLSRPNKSTARDKNTLSIVLECVLRSPCACSLWLLLARPLLCLVSDLLRGVSLGTLKTGRSSKCWMNLVS
jgi:hypothetical protein